MPHVKMQTCRIPSAMNSNKYLSVSDFSFRHCFVHGRWDIFDQIIDGREIDQKSTIVFGKEMFRLACHCSLSAEEGGTD